MFLPTLDCEMLAVINEGKDLKIGVTIVVEISLTQYKCNWINLIIQYFDFCAIIFVFLSCAGCHASHMLVDKMCFCAHKKTENKLFLIG